MDTKQSFLHVSINFTPLRFNSLQLSIKLSSFAVILPLIIIHDTFFAVFLPCSYTPLNYHSEQSPLQLYIIYLIYTILYFTIYYSITIIPYLLLQYIHNTIFLYPILYIFLSLLYLKNCSLKFFLCILFYLLFYIVNLLLYNILIIVYYIIFLYSLFFSFLSPIYYSLIYIFFIFL